jgi:hypothetical protein
LSNLLFNTVLKSFPIHVHEFIAITI